MFFNSEEENKQKQKAYSQSQPKPAKRGPTKFRNDFEENTEQDNDDESIKDNDDDGYAQEKEELTKDDNNKEAENDVDTIGIDFGTSCSYVGVWQNDRVNIIGNDRLYRSEDSSKILVNLKDIAEAHIGKEVKNAVITVPVHFNYQQRQAIRDAGSVINLNVLSIMNESTAVAMAYLDKGKDEEEEKNVLIFDLGSGSLDVSLVSIADNIIEIEATTREQHVGGDHFDKCMVEFLLADIKRRHGKDISQSKRALLRLQTECEKAKRNLCSSYHTNIEINALFDNIDINVTITRARFEDLCMEYFKRCMGSVEKILRESRISKEFVDEIVLVGGSTRIPKIQSLLSNFFNGKNIWKSINPEEAVVYGATVHAAVLSGKNVTPDKLSQIRYFDLIPHSLGIETAGGVMTTMVKKNEMTPFKKTLTFTTNSDNQSAVYIKLYEGDNTMTRDNNFIGKLILDGIPLMRAGKPQIVISCDVGTDGILAVTVVERMTGKENKITIKGTMESADITPMSQNGAINIYIPSLNE